MRKLSPIAVLMLAAMAFAAPPRSLTRFDVTAADGSIKQAAQLARSGKWLLIFVKSNCPQCDSLLSTLDGPSTQDGSRVVIVVKTPNANALAQFKARFPAIPNAAWYADARASAARSLEVPASPTTLGMRDASIAWRLTGGITALPTDEASGIPLSADAASNPKVREHALVNGWLKQP